jgi:hypothetical protein
VVRGEKARGASAEPRRVGDPERHPDLDLDLDLDPDLDLDLDLGLDLDLDLALYPQLLRMIADVTVDAYRKEGRA